MSITLYEHILPEVENVARNYMEIEITNKEIENITTLIANKDKSIPNFVLYEDPNIFLNFGDEDDWSGINDQLEGVVKWYLKQNELVRMFTPKKHLLKE